MNNNIIKIKGASLEQVKKALKNWIKLYSDNFSSILTFEIYRKSINCQIILADKLLDNEHFFFLVNYLEYPEEIEYNVEVEGLTIGKSLDDRLNNKKMLIYLSKIDKEYDNVYAVTKDQKHYKIDFGGKVSEQTESKQYSIFEIGDLKKSVTLSTIKKTKDKINDNKSKISKRFKIIFYILLIAVLLHFLVPFFTNNIDIIDQWTYYTGLGIGLWFLFDYEMLRIKEFYFKSFLIAIGFFFYGYLFRNIYQEYNSNLTNVIFIHPLTLLLIQFPLRKFYINLFNREPKVGNHGTSTDFIYTIILFFSFLILPFYIFDYVN